MYQKRKLKQSQKRSVTGLLEAVNRNASSSRAFQWFHYRNKSPIHVKYSFLKNLKNAVSNIKN